MRERYRVHLKVFTEANARYFSILIPLINWENGRGKLDQQHIKSPSPGLKTLGYPAIWSQMTCSQILQNTTGKKVKTGSQYAFTDPIIIIPNGQTRFSQQKTAQFHWKHVKTKTKKVSKTFTSLSPSLAPFTSQSSTITRSWNAHVSLY